MVNSEWRFYSQLTTHYSLRRNIMKKIFTALISIFVFGLAQCITLAQDSDINFIAYVSRLGNKVKSNWVIPHGKLDKKAVILLDIDKTGKLLGANVVNFSGDKDFDKTALDAIIKSAPFEGFPQNITDEKATIKITFDQREFEASAVSDIKVSDANNAETNICPVAEKKSTGILQNSPLVMVPHYYRVQPYYYYRYRPEYYYHCCRSDFYNHYRPYCNKDIPYYAPRIVNNYYTQVPSDFSSPVTRFWAADRLIWLSFLVAHVCKHGI